MCFILAALTIIRANNQIAIAFAENSEFHKRTKHIDTKFHWVQEVIKRGVFLLKFLPTRFMAADRITKPLPPKQFQRFLGNDGNSLIIEKLNERSWYGGVQKEWKQAVDRSQKGVLADTCEVSGIFQVCRAACAVLHQMFT